MDLSHELAGVSSSPETKALYTALAQAQMHYKPIKRSCKNAIEDFRYATFRDICDAVMPGLLAHGFTQPTFATGFDKAMNRWVMVGTLNHTSGEWISSLCPLLLGYEESRPSIRELEIDCTYAKKILMQGLCGGWMEGEDGEPAVEPAAVAVVEEKKEDPIPVVKQEVKKDTKPSDQQVIQRARDALKAKAGDEAAIQQIWDHLATFVESGRITEGDVLVLQAEHKLGAKTVKVTEQPKRKPKEEKKKEVPVAN